jgi:hypothetical protein
MPYLVGYTRVDIERKNCHIVKLSISCREKVITNANMGMVKQYFYSLRRADKIKR